LLHFGKKRRKTQQSDGQNHDRDQYLDHCKSAAAPCAAAPSAFPQRHDFVETAGVSH
jgi:hypothetical protein